MLSRPTSTSRMGPSYKAAHLVAAHERNQPGCGRRTIPHAANHSGSNLATPPVPIHGSPERLGVPTKDWQSRTPRRETFPPLGPFSPRVSCSHQESAVRLLVGIQALPKTDSFGPHNVASPQFYQTFGQKH